MTFDAYDSRESSCNEQPDRHVEREHKSPFYISRNQRDNSSVNHFSDEKTLAGRLEDKF